MGASKYWSTATGELVATIDEPAHVAFAQGDKLLAQAELTAAY